LDNCYTCGCELKIKNRSEEHIFPNSIGGRLTSINLLCKNCNSKFGSKPDFELAKQFNVFTNYLMVKRKRGNPTPIELVNEKTGEKISMDYKGMPIMEKPLVQEMKENNLIKFSIESRSTKEARKIIMGLSRKYKKLNYEEVFKQAKNIEIEITDPLYATISVGGNESFSAILKIALNYYIMKTNDVNSVCNAINDLKNNIVEKINLIILERCIFNLDDDEVSHSIYLVGSQVERKLYAVIELFNAVQFIVKLSENYCKPDFEDLFVFDVLLCKKKDKAIKYRPEINYLLDFERPFSSQDIESYKQKISRILEIALKRRQDVYLNKVVNEAWDDIITKNNLEGETMTTEIANSLSSRVAKDFVNYYYRMSGNSFRLK
jgi:hypothetical protein